MGFRPSSGHSRSCRVVYAAFDVVHCYLLLAAHPRLIAMNCDSESCSHELTTREFCEIAPEFQTSGMLYLDRDRNPHNM